MVNTKIWATERPEDTFDIGCRVIKWDESQGVDFAKTWKFTPTNCTDLSSLQKKISQFTVHWAVSRTAKALAAGLKARGLSCNFGIDDDCDSDGFATIYQYLPISKLGWSQGSHVNGVSFNSKGPGIEICFDPQAWDGLKYPVAQHPVIKAPIHGTTLTVHQASEAQMKSLKSIIWGFSQLFPDVPMTFPKDDKGKLITTVLKDPLNYKGLCNHYNLKRGKIDTAGLDTESIEKDVQEMKQVGYNIFRNI